MSKIRFTHAGVGFKWPTTAGAREGMPLNEVSNLYPGSAIVDETTRLQLVDSSHYGYRVYIDTFCYFNKLLSGCAASR